MLKPLILRLVVQHLCKKLSILMPNSTVIAAENDVVVPPFRHAVVGARAPMAVLRQRPHPAQRPGHLLPCRLLDRVCDESPALLALLVGPLGHLAPAASRPVLDLADVVLPNVRRLTGRVKEEAEHVGRGLVVGDSRPVKAHEAARRRA